MFTLYLERGRYLRVRSGVVKRDIERCFSFPVHADVFAGAIIAVMPQPNGFCYAEPCDTYFTIAQREGVDEEQLKELNASSPLYPSKKVWLP